MLERGNLRGAGRGLHLLAEARDFAAMPVGVRLLAAAKFFFAREVLANLRERLLSGLERGFGSRDAPRSLGLLLAKALQFQVLRLENDEMFEVGIHCSGFITGGSALLRLRAREPNIKPSTFVERLSCVAVARIF